MYLTKARPRHEGLPRVHYTPEDVLVTPSCLRLSWRWPECRPPQLCRGCEQRRAILIFIIVIYFKYLYSQRVRGRAPVWVQWGALCFASPAAHLKELASPRSPKISTAEICKILFMAMPQCPQLTYQPLPCGEIPLHAHVEGDLGWQWYKMWLQMKEGTVVG